MSAKKAAQEAETTKSSQGFTDEERAAMKERAKEVKAETRRGASAKADGESDVLAKIAEMPEADRELATEVHRIVRASAPELTCRTWYGMPAWSREGKVVCFFQSGAKFKTRYSTFGFQDPARLDDGDIWPIGYAITAMNKAVEARVIALLKQATG